MGVMAKRVSTIIIFIVVAILASAQTTKPMKEDNQETNPLYSYTEKELEKVSAYIERQYGEYKEVMHEMVSPDIHCDIVIVPPTDVSPYYKLVTMGAGAYKMRIPNELKSTICDRAEYVIFLPKDWNIIGVDNEENWWPMRMLKSAARLTVDTDDYLCITHSVQVAVQLLRAYALHRQGRTGGRTAQIESVRKEGGVLPIVPIIPGRVEVQTGTWF